jgi:hypothetical protein
LEEEKSILDNQILVQNQRKSILKAMQTLVMQIGKTYLITGEMLNSIVIRKTRMQVEVFSTKEGRVLILG